LTRSSGALQDSSGLEKRFEEAAKLAADAAVEFRLPSNAAVYSVEKDGRLLKETADGRRFEVQLAENAEETIVAEIPRA
jgi:hypothetical protein